MSWARRKVRRAVLLMEMDDGTQHGYEITSLTEATVSMGHHVDPPDFRYAALSTDPYGRVEVEGRFRSLVRTPDMDDFTEHDGIDAARPALEP